MTENCGESATEEQERLWKDALTCGWWNGYDQIITIFTGALDVMLAEPFGSNDATMCAATFLGWKTGLPICYMYAFTASLGYFSHIYLDIESDYSAVDLEASTEAWMNEVVANFDSKRDCEAIRNNILSQLNYEGGSMTPEELTI